MAANAGTAYLQVIPSLEGAKSSLEGDLSGIGQSIGDDIGKDINKGIESEVGDKGDGIGKKLGAGIIAGIGAIGIGAALAASIEAETSNANLGAKLGLDPAEQERLGALAGRLYANAYGDSLDQVNDAVAAVKQNISQIGSDAELETITGDVLNLAQVFDQDLGGVTKSVGQLITTGLVKNATEGIDLITAGFQRIPGATEDLLETLNEYGTQFRKVGIDGPTALGLIQQAVLAGARDTDIAADAIKEFAIRAVDGSMLTAEGFQAIGLNAEEMSAAIAAGGPQASEALAQTLDGLRSIEDPALRAQAATALFGTQAEDLGEALFALDPRTATETFGDVAGSAEDMGKTLANTTSGSLSDFLRDLSKIGTDLLSHVLPPLTEFIKFIGPLVVGAISSAIKFIGQVIDRLKELGGWVQKNTSWLAPLGVALGIVVLGLSGSAIAAGAMGIALGIASTVGSAFAVVMGLINTVLKANPILLVVTLLAALVGALITAWQTSEGFRDIVLSVWEAVSSAVVTAVTAVRDAIVVTFTAVRDFLVSIWEGIKTAALTAWGFIRDYIVTPVLVAKDAIITAFSAVGGFLAGIWEAILGGVAAAWGAIVSVIKGALNIIIDIINGVISAINFFIDGYNFLAGAVGAVAGIDITISTIPKIPHLADGGILTAPTLFLGGEGGESEAVLPLSKLEAMLTDERSGGPADGVTVNITVNQLPGEDEAALAERIGKRLERTLRK